MQLHSLRQRTIHGIRRASSFVSARFIALLAAFFLLTFLVEHPAETALSKALVPQALALPFLEALVWAIAAHRVQPFRCLWYFAITLGGLYAETLNAAEVTLSTRIQWVNVGLCLYLLDASMRKIGWTWIRRVALAAVFSVSLAVALLVVSVTIYNRSRGIGLDEPALFAVWETSSHEALGFVDTQLKKNHIMVMAAMLLGILGLHLLLARREPRTSAPGVGLLAPAFLLLLTAANRRNSPVVNLIEDTFVRFKDEIQQLEKGVKERQSLAGKVDASRSGPAETHVIIVGESHNRDHMGAYGYVRDTTPWLSRMARERELHLFRNAFSNHTHTTRVLTLALTMAQQYRPGYYWSMPSLLDVANAAGFETTWISNQGHIGAHDSPVTILASAAKRQLWRKQTLRPDDPPGDMRLVRQLAEIAPGLDPDRSHLIFLHLNGSHWPYCEQFPKSQNHYRDMSGLDFGALAKDPATVERVNCYDDSVRYNDLVLSRIFDEAKELPNLASITYFSDHGEEVNEGHAHTVSEFDYRMIQIPLWIWLSPKYAARNPERARSLARHHDVCFTNDLMHDTLVGLLGIETTHQAPIFDLSSARYSLDCQLGRTLHGRMPIEHHPRLALETTLKALHPKEAVALHVATLGKLHESLARGFRELEVGLLLDAARPPGDRLHLGSSRERPGEGTLADLLASPASSEVRKLFLRIHNLEVGNQETVISELEQVRARFPRLASRLVIEIPEDRHSTTATFVAEGWPVGVHVSTRSLPAARKLAARLRSPSGFILDVESYAAAQQFLAKSSLPLVLWLRQWPEAGSISEQAYMRDPKVRAFAISFSSSFEP